MSVYLGIGVMTVVKITGRKERMSCHVMAVKLVAIKSGIIECKCTIYKHTRRAGGAKNAYKYQHTQQTISVFYSFTIGMRTPRKSWLTTMLLWRYLMTVH